MYKKLIVTVLMGLFYLSCKNEQNKITTSTGTESPSAAEEVAQAVDIKAKQAAQLNTNGLEWLTLKDALKSPQAGSKMMLLDIYTEWCGYCKLMDKKTFADESIQELLSDNFRLVKFDAESKDSIEMKGEMFGWRADGKRGIHELAAELLDGQLSYPTLIFLDENLKTIRISRGYKNPAELRQEVEMALRS